MAFELTLGLREAKHSLFIIPWTLFIVPHVLHHRNAVQKKTGHSKLKLKLLTVANFRYQLSR